MRPAMRRPSQPPHPRCHPGLEPRVRPGGAHPERSHHRRQVVRSTTPWQLGRLGPAPQRNSHASGNLRLGEPPRKGAHRAHRGGVPSLQISIPTVSFPRKREPLFPLPPPRNRDPRFREDDPAVIEWSHCAPDPPHPSRPGLSRWAILAATRIAGTTPVMTSWLPPPTLPLTGGGVHRGPQNPQQKP